MPDKAEKLLEELIEAQKTLLLALGRHLVPSLTAEDLLQPNDYPQLEKHPLFRYEEGFLAGLLATQSALRALKIEIRSGNQGTN